MNHCLDCGCRISKRAKRCPPCSQIARRAVRRHFDSQSGYVQITWHDETGRLRKRLEHRVVMESQLGRALRRDEQVHHVNGVRHDNRPENLELWITFQPAGQRPCDLLAWAEEVIERYREECGL